MQSSFAETPGLAREFTTSKGWAQTLYAGGQAPSSRPHAWCVVERLDLES